MPSRSTKRRTIATQSANAAELLTAESTISHKSPKSNGSQIVSIPNIQSKAIDNGNGIATSTSMVARGTKRKRTKAVKEEDKQEPDDAPPKVTNGSKNKVAKGEDVDMPSKPRKSSRKKKDVSYALADGVEKGEEQAAEHTKEKTKKTRKPRAPKPEPVYHVEPITQHLQTSFKGRLGYACLNTVLRAQKPPVFCSRTCRLATLEKEGLDWVKELGRQNAKDLLELVKWNEANHIKFMRVSSEMFPFASHGVHGYTLEFVDAELRAVGDFAREHGHRLTMHPGQFTQLGSPRQEVITNSIRELEYQCEVLDRIGLGKDSVMIMHMGGMYGDKAATLERFKRNYSELCSERVKARLVLENDEICYNVDDLLPVCQELNIPLIFDWHHDWINPSKRANVDLLDDINATWHRKGIRPKQHHSEPRPGAISNMEKRAHADRVQIIPPCGDDMDLMIEAKDKEQAVLWLMRLYNLVPDDQINNKSLRPPAEVESLRTNGRKSHKKKKVGKESEAGEEAELSCGDDDEEPVKVEEMEGDDILYDEEIKTRAKKVSKVSEGPKGSKASRNKKEIKSVEKVDR